MENILQFIKNGCILMCWFCVSFFLLLINPGEPSERPIPNVRYWSAEQRRDWIYSEIKQFLEKYVFLHTTELTEFVNAVEDLRILDRTGYPCRECGRTFKYHSTRVKYNLILCIVIIYPCYINGCVIHENLLMIKVQRQTWSWMNIYKILSYTTKIN